jgi:hypothetical protein
MNVDKAQMDCDLSFITEVIIKCFFLSLYINMNLIKQGQRVV